MRIGGLDPSLNSSGFALHDGSVYTLKFPVKQRLPTRMHERDWARERCLLVKAEALRAFWMCDLVVIESFSYGSKNGREILGYLGHSIREAFESAGIRFLDIPPTTLKRFATGHGQADKKAVKAAAVKSLGLSPDEPHDCADALWLRELGRHMYGVSTRVPPSGTTEHLKKIEIPDLGKER